MATEQRYILGITSLHYLGYYAIPEYEALAGFIGDFDSLADAQKAARELDPETKPNWVEARLLPRCWFDHNSYFLFRNTHPA